MVWCVEYSTTCSNGGSIGEEHSSGSKLDYRTECQDPLPRALSFQTGCESADIIIIIIIFPAGCELGIPQNFQTGCESAIINNHSLPAGCEFGIDENNNNVPAGCELRTPHNSTPPDAEAEAKAGHNNTSLPAGCESGIDEITIISG